MFVAGKIEQKVHNTLWCAFLRHPVLQPFCDFSFILDIPNFPYVTMYMGPYKAIQDCTQLKIVPYFSKLFDYYLFSLWKETFNFFFIQCFLLSQSCKITHQDCQSCLRHKRIRQFRLIQKVSIYFYLVSVSKWVFIRQILRSRSYPKKLISSHTVCLSVNLHLLRCWCI